jgi:hypothetical protein
VRDAKHHPERGQYRATKSSPLSADLNAGL